MKTGKIKVVEKSDVVNTHLKDISKIYPLTAQEERDLFAKYEDTADEEERRAIRDKIVTASLRFNYSIARCYSTGDNLPDLISVGIIGMYEAFNEYDWHKGVRFYTFASYYIRRACNAYLAKDDLTVRTKNFSAVNPKVKKIEKEFTAENGRKPSNDEIIDILKSEYGVNVFSEMDLHGAKVDSIDAYLGDDDDNTLEGSADFNNATATRNEYESEIDDDDNRYKVDAMMSALDDREKKIISMAYGYGYPREYKDKEIGDELNLTSERVRQLRHGAVKKMRAAYATAENI